MNFDDALIYIEGQIENPEKLNLDELANILSLAASYPDGYSGRIWECSGRLVEAIRSKKNYEGGAFDDIVLQTIATAFVSSIARKDVIRCLSLVQYELFSNKKDINEILKDVRIEVAIKKGIDLEPLSFIVPSDLGSTSLPGQEAFGVFLSVVDQMQVNDELRLQWSASILRFCPSSSSAFLTATEILIKTLLNQQRQCSAYYIFRAISENQNTLWCSEIPIEIVISMIKIHINNPNESFEILLELCHDADVQKECISNKKLQFIINVLSIHFWKEHQETSLESMSWDLPTSIQSNYPNFSSKLVNFIQQNELPVSPPRFKNKLQLFESEFLGLINEVQNELRSRGYRGVPLAINIYQDNIKNCFEPIFQSVKNRDNAGLILNHLKNLDPESIITENLLQKNSNFPIEGNLLQQMIRDNRAILDVMENATSKLKEIQIIHSELSMISKDQFDFIIEYELFESDLSEKENWVFANLLPDLWRALKISLDIYNQEEDLYGTR